MHNDRNTKNGSGRHVIAWLLVLVCAAAQITVSVPRFHSHPTGLTLAGHGTTASEARPAQKHERGDPAAHECLACRVLSLVSTLTRVNTVAAPAQQTVAAISCVPVQGSQVRTSSVRGRAPPLA